MNKESLIKLIKKNAIEINQKNSNPMSYDQLAFPGGLEHAFDSFKRNDTAIIETAIIYLEADPYFYRSGYIKQKIARLLKQSVLSSHHILQLQEVLIINIQRGRRQREYARLARKIQTPAFIKQLQEIMDTSKDNGIVEEIKMVLRVINS